MTELVTERTARAKVFDLGGGRRRVVSGIAPVHVPNDYAKFVANQRDKSITWGDIDLGYDERANDHTMRSGWYGLEIPKGEVGYTYTSKVAGGTVVVRLRELDGVPLAAVGPPVVSGSDATWNVTDGLQIILRVRAGSVELFKRIEHSKAPRSFLWEITAPLGDFPLKTKTEGVDNADAADQSRLGAGPGRCRRVVVMQHEITEDDGTVPGSVHFFERETWTGQTIALDKDRVRSLSDDVVYPVLIDQDITETIVDVNDDGNQNRNNQDWQAQYNATGDHIIYNIAPYGFHPGYRFQSVAIPVGATIDSANLRINIDRSSGGAGGGATLYGNDVDDAPAWANGAGPRQMTPTTASVAFGPWGAAQSGDKDMNVTAIIAEIVARAGWSSGNDIALGVQGTLTGGYSYINDLNGGSSNIAVLTIDYTVGGGGNRRRRTLMGTS